MRGHCASSPGPIGSERPDSACFQVKLADLSGRTVESERCIARAQTPGPTWSLLAKERRAECMVIVHVSPTDEKARALMQELDAEIAALYPGSLIMGIDEAEFEKSGGYFVIAQEAGQTIGCGGFRPIDQASVEIKRMFVRASARRRGVARGILRHLEEEVRRRGYRSTVLETGCNNTGAIALYESEGYSRIPDFLGCAGIAISRCYSKSG